MIEQLQTRYGTMFVPDTDTGQYWWLKNTGASPEDVYIELVCSVLAERPRGIAIDVGACFGCWSLPLARVAETVIAVEPQRSVLEVLCKTVAANNAANNGWIEVWPVALGSTLGEAVIQNMPLDKPANFGGASMVDRRPDQPRLPAHHVDVKALDFVMGWRDRRISFIKADVEGAEPYVLLGAQKTIARWKPVLFVEAVHPLTDTQALGRQIESMGYNVELQGANFLGMPI